MLVELLGQWAIGFTENGRTNYDVSIQVPATCSGQGPKGRLHLCKTASC